MQENAVNHGVNASAGRAGSEGKAGLSRHVGRHSCKCGETSPEAFYASMPYRCKACQRAKMRAHYATPAYREKAARYRREYLKDPAQSAKHAARTALARAVKVGKVERPIHCGDCGILGPTHGHHEDYDKPLDVVWLCRACHAKRHGGRVKKAIVAAFAALLLFTAPVQASGFTYPTQAEMECVHTLTKLPYPKELPKIIVQSVAEFRAHADAMNMPFLRGVYFKPGIIILREGAPYSFRIHEIAHHFGADEQLAYWVQGAVSRGWCQ